MTITRAMLAALDRDDPLAPMRAQFALPDGVVYLDGNSLGPLPRAAGARIAAVVQAEWGEGLIRSWNTHGWIDLARRIGDKIARLIGAPPGSTIVADSTSVNVFKALGAALALRPDRRVIVTEADNFPTDLYIADGLARLLGRGHTLRRIDPDDIAAALDDEVAAVLLTQVNYRTGRLLDMGAITRAAHAAGAVMVWDLAHSVGALPVDLTAHDVDLAVGCGYKFLNGGPGAPAFLFVAPRLHDTIRMPLTGWLGHDAPFAFEPVFRPAAGIARAVVGTPPILSLAALEVGVDIALQTPMDALRAKSLRQSALFADLVAQECAGLDLNLISPTDDARRGSQVCLTHPSAYPVMQALIDQNVIGDMRAPDILRFGITPLYLRYTDLWDAVATLARTLHEGTWRDPRFAVRGAVT